MRHMRTVLIVEHEEQVFDRLTCDLCGAESNSDENWSQDAYAAATTSIHMEERQTNRAGGSGYSTETMFHLCPACFRDKLKPWLEAQGARATESRADW